MADHTITLSAEYEIALTALRELWQRTQPETAWTEDLVLARLVELRLTNMLAEIDGNLKRLRDIGRQLPGAARAQILAAMTGAEKARLQQLLS